MLALIFYKPAAAAVYATAFTMIGYGKDPRTILMGFTMVLLSLVALPALMKFFTWTTGAIDGPTGGGFLGTVVSGAVAVGALRASGLGGGSAAGQARLMATQLGPPNGPGPHGGAGPHTGGPGPGLPPAGNPNTASGLGPAGGGPGPGSPVPPGTAPPGAAASTGAGSVAREGTPARVAGGAGSGAGAGAGAAAGGTGAGAAARAGASAAGAAAGPAGAAVAGLASGAAAGAAPAVRKAADATQPEQGGE